MLPSLAILLLCQLAGEVIARGFALPVPGPVIGLLLLAGGLFLWARSGRLSDTSVDATELGKTANGLLGVLGILFIPAGVGVIQHVGLISEYGAAVMLALAVSTALTLVVTVWVFIGVSNLIARRG